MEVITKTGAINRKDIVNEFRISSAQASFDLRLFKDLNPGFIEYNGSTKRYERKS